MIHQWLLVAPLALYAAQARGSKPHASHFSLDRDEVEERKLAVESPEPNHCIVYADGGSTGIKFEGKQWDEAKKKWIAHGEWNMKDIKVNGEKMWYNFVKDIGNPTCLNWRYLFGLTDMDKTGAVECSKLLPVDTDGKITYNKGEITKWKVGEPPVENKDSCELLEELFWEDSVAKGLRKDVFNFKGKDEKVKLAPCKSWEIEVFFTGGLRGNCGKVKVEVEGADKNLNLGPELRDLFVGKMKQYLKRKDGENDYVGPSDVLAKIIDGANEEGPLSKLGYRVTMGPKATVTPDVMVELGGASVQAVTSTKPYVVEKSSVDAIKAMICKDYKAEEYYKDGDSALPLSVCRMNCVDKEGNVGEVQSNVTPMKWEFDGVEHNEHDHELGQMLTGDGQDSVTFDLKRCTKMVDAALEKNDKDRGGVGSVVSTMEEIRKTIAAKNVALITLPEAVVKRWPNGKQWSDWKTIIETYKQFTGKGPDTFATVKRNTGCDCVYQKPEGDVKVQGEASPGFTAPAESCKQYCTELFGDFAQEKESAANEASKNPTYKGVTSATWRYNGLKISAVVSVLKKLDVVDDNGDSIDGKTVTVGSGGWLEACVWIKEKAADLEKAGYKITSCHSDGINGDSVNELIEYYLTGNVAPNNNVRAKELDNETKEDMDSVEANNGNTKA